MADGPGPLPGDQHGPVAAAVAGLRLVDHHAHPALIRELAPGEFEMLITESDRPAAAGTSRFDSQLGVAIRRWCGPVLGLPPAVPAREYLAARAELGGPAVATALLRASGIARFLVDTGYRRDGMATLPEMASLSSATVGEVVRLEQVAEETVAAGDATARGFSQRLREALWQRTRDAVAVKSIIAYRCGLDVAPEPPSAARVTQAAGAWLRRVDSGLPARLNDPVLLRHLLWAGVDRGLPVQIHTGFGDPDLDLHRANPLLLRPFLERAERRGVAILLLHCYPYHREAGYLAHAYPHVYLDVGLALTHVGARATAVVGESLELAPFAKLLFSTDGFALPELHYLGALLWRRAVTSVLGGWVSSGDWSAADAVTVATMIGAGNARRLYRGG